MCSQTASNLRELCVGGVVVEEDALAVPGVWATTSPPSDPVSIDTADDHRMAMAFAVLGLRRPGVSITHPQVVAKSYPGFWDDFDSVLPGG